MPNYQLPSDLTLLRPRRAEEFWNYPNDPELKRMISRLESRGPRRASLLAGPFGSGKTCLAYFVGMWASCSVPLKGGLPCGDCDACFLVATGAGRWRGRFHELDASDDDIVGQVLDAYNRSAETSIFDVKVEFHVRRPAVIFIDEAHRITPKNQDRLLKLFERCGDVRFVMATAKPEKIDLGLLNRVGAALYSLCVPSVEDAARHLCRVADLAGACLDASVAALIAEHAERVPRVCLSALDELLCYSNEITIDVWHTVFGGEKTKGTSSSGIQSLIDVG